MPPGGRATEKRPTIAAGPKDPTRLSGPSVRDLRRSFVDEQYSTFVRNNSLGAGELRRLRDSAAGLEHKPPISLLLPVPDPNTSYLRETLDSVLGQVYPGWELRVVVANSRGEVGRTVGLYAGLDRRVKVEETVDGARESAMRNAALACAEGEFVAFVAPGDELAPDALLRVVEVLQGSREAGLVYSDHDHVDGRGERSRPSFKPGWSPDLLLSHDYLSDLAVYRKSLIEEAGGFGDGLDGYHAHDLALRVSERTDEIRHVPRVLYHRRVPGTSRPPGTARGVVRGALERRGVEGSVEDGLVPGRLRVKYGISGSPKVSIIIPTRDNGPTLKNCVESVERLTNYRNYEILIVDNDSADPETLEYLSSTPHRVVPFREPFNYSRINNFAVSQADGKYVLLLNDDTEITDGGWLEEMLGHAQRSGVGAVGAKLLYPNGTIQHAGVIVGVGDPWGPGIAVHAHQFFPDGPGYAGGVQTAANFSAVTAACMLMRKAVFEEAGGLDEENLKVAFNDVDLCLRIRERGYRIVYTPHASLLHHESMSRGYGGGNPAELLYMRERWGRVLDGDPYYNAHFSRGGGDYNLRADLMRPRVLRTVGRIPDDPVYTFKSPLRTSPEEMQRYVWAHRKASRSAHRTTLVPALPESPLEILRSGDATPAQAPGLRGGGNDRAGTPTPGGTGGARGFGNLRAERLVWMFGSPRTGSTWLSRMMAELDNQERWHEPYIGLLFGSFVYERLQNSKLLGSASFIMGEPHRKVWLDSIKNFLLEGAGARYPKLREDQYLVIKEPNGSVGAPLLLEATPTSRLIFLIRDPRDVVASRLDAFRKDSWSAQERDLDSTEELNAFTRQLAEDYFNVVSQVRTAYETHQGPKVLVRYEDLRRDTVGTLKGMYDGLKITVDEKALEAATAKHAWERVPEGNKGPGKFYRKARPGGWEEDLSPEQVGIIEDATCAILSEFYWADRPV